MSRPLLSDRRPNLRKGTHMKKGQRIKTARRIDLRSTGGPLIEAGDEGTIIAKRRTGELWINLDKSGHRHLLPQDVVPVV